MLNRVEELLKDLQHEDASTASAIDPATSRLSHPTLQNPTAPHPKPQTESAYPKAIRFNGDRPTDEIHILGNKVGGVVERELRIVSKCS